MQSGRRHGLLKPPVSPADCPKSGHQRSPPNCGGKLVGLHWDSHWRTAVRSLHTSRLTAWRLQDLSHGHSQEDKRWHIPISLPFVPLKQIYT